MSIGTYFFLIIYIYFKIENMWQYLVYILSPSLSTIHDGKLRIIKYSFYPQHTFLSSHTFLPDITFHSFSYNYVNGNQGCLFRQYKIHTNHSMVNRCKSTIFINILKKHLWKTQLFKSIHYCDFSTFFVVSTSTMVSKWINYIVTIAQKLIIM